MIRGFVRAACALALAGAALAVSGAPASAQAGPVGYTYGAEIAGNGISCGFYAIDLPTGVAELVSPDPRACADGLAFAADGTLYGYVSRGGVGLAEAFLVTIDPATGAQTEIGQLPPVNAGSGGMTFDAAGNLWLYAPASAVGVDPNCGETEFEVCLWRVDRATAAAEFVGAAPPGLLVPGLTATCGSVLGVTSPVEAPFEDVLQQVDTATAGLSPLVTLANVQGQVAGSDHDASGRLWVLAVPDVNGAGQWETHLVDPATGGSTAAPVTVDGGPFIGVFFGLGVSPLSCPTPEPIVLEPTFTG